jgi:2-polyprenyl-6-methoxyphenol hydroxylase-like FAD-dependent oxidoreductase
MLGRQGHTVVGVERHPAPYPLPRAVILDHETARILNGIGIDPETDPATIHHEDRYPMLSASGQVLMEVDWISRAADGFRNRYWFHQPPLLESRLREIAWFADARADHIIVRPDYYVAATASGQDVDRIVALLAQNMSLRER